MLYSNQELSKILGDGIRTIRKTYNRMTMKELSRQAQISLYTVRTLELGKGTVEDLVKVLNVLGKADWIKAIEPQISVNPLLMKRRRTSK